MLKQRGEKTADGKWSIPAAERNKDPILGVLARVLPSRGLVLEVASGTGQHVMHFAEALSELTWQPSDPDPELRESIALRIQEERRANVKWPIHLDVSKLPWPLQNGGCGAGNQPDSRRSMVGDASIVRRREGSAFDTGGFVLIRALPSLGSPHVPEQRAVRS
jgi:hypothetical protein